MFNGNRRFNGRQGEQIYNEELYKIYEILKHFLDTPENPDPSVGPQADMKQAGSLWLDRQTSPGYGHIMYKDTDRTWKPIFDDYFKLTKDIRYADGEPKNPLEGQLWINENGVLNWYNGSSFVPIKSKIADSVEFDSSVFENFLVIDPLNMSGGYILENFSKLASQAGGITEWKPSTVYNNGSIVFHNDSDGESRFYQYKLTSKSRLSSTSFNNEIEGGYLELINLKAQYLIPSETFDKIFTNGMYTDCQMYTKKSDVCIELDLGVYEGKTIAAVHVNPVALKNIKKRIIKVDNDTKSKNFGCIRVQSDTTEYYGMINGFGHLLIKGVDYVPYGGFIKLTKAAAEIYKYVYTVTYQFDTKIKNKGFLQKNTITLSNQTSIWIGQIEENEKILTFAQGLALEDFYYTYNYYDKDGLVRFAGFDSEGNLTNVADKIAKPLFESRTDVAIMRFDNVSETGLFDLNALTSYTENGAKKYRATIKRPAGFIEPEVFVQGIKLDITAGETNIVVDDVCPGSAYTIADMSHNRQTMKCYTGTVGTDCAIPLRFDGFTKGTHRPLVFVEGFYISQADMDMSDGATIKINGLTKGQKYTVYKDIDDDDTNRLVYDGTVAFCTIPVSDRIDDALVYVEDSLIIDGAACYSIEANVTNAVDNEVRAILSNGYQKWCIYNKETARWIPLSSTDEIMELDSTTSGYSADQKTINILQNYGKDKKCTYYAYTFADNIEHPLMRGTTRRNRTININGIDSNGVPITEKVKFYEINRKHYYRPDSNALNVWAYGIKQSVREHYIIENNEEIQGFIVPYSEEDIDYLYIIENPENNEYMSCSYEIINSQDGVGVGTYKTSQAILSPGVVSLYIDGIRQNQSSFIVDDMSTFTIVEPPITNNNMVSFTDDDGNIQIVSVDKSSDMRVEVRRDFKLKEKTITLTEEYIEESMSQGLRFTSGMLFGKTRLPEDLFNSKISEIQIFINGLAYGNEFNKDDDALILTSPYVKASNNIDKHENGGSLISYVKAGDTVTFEWR